MTLIEFKHISKSFDHLTACSDVSLSIEKNTVHAVIGENGAGKSTLMKMLGGLIQPSSGSILLSGKAYKPQTAQDAFKNKIAFIHQHFVLAEQLTALDNVILSASAFQFSLSVKNTRQITEKTRLLLKKFNWHMPLEKVVSELSVGEQQRLEIIKALLQEPEIIIFDEPTAVLAPQESEELMIFIQQLRTEGKTIILISHKLNEIKAVADQVSVLRQGRHVLTKKNSDISLDEMAEAMIGRRRQPLSTTTQSGERTALFSIPGSRIEIERSEIFGVAGIEGNGQSALIKSFLAELRKNNIPYGDITEDRLKLSVFPDYNLAEHMLLRHADRFTTKSFIDHRSLLSATEELLRRWDVRPPEPQKLLTELSGGNQQKFMVGRELWHRPDVLVAAHPSRGVDLGAQDMIHQAFSEMAQSGKTVFLVSSDLDEILKLSNRFVIINKGQLHGPFVKGQLTEKEIGLYMAGDL